MSDVLRLGLALLAGAGLGLFYFGGLWLTLRRLATSGRPELLILGSFLARTAITVIGFYFVIDGQWDRLAASLAGFLLMRIFLVQRLKPQPPKP